MNSEDDELSPYPNSSRKLASLFENNDIPSGGNSSLMYKAPKQPRALSKQPQVTRNVPQVAKNELSNNDSFIVVYATTVQTFKFENNEYKPKGKTGVAIVFNNTHKLYQLLLYKDKTEIFAQALINSQFSFNVLPKDYATFYDKHKCLWSVLFENSENGIEFITQLAIAKWFCAGKTNVFTQDLIILESDKVIENGVFVDISYDISLLSPDNKLEKKVESYRNERINIVSEKEGQQFWESILLGMSVGSKKLILLPAKQSGNWVKYIPDKSKNYGLLISVLVEKFVNSADVKTIKSENVDSSDVKSKTDSIKDALTTSPSLVRANLISRMAKMGQSTLPLKGAIVATSGISDSSETEEDGLSSASLSDNVSKKPSIPSKSNVKDISSLKPTESSNVSYQHQISVPPVSLPTTICQQPVTNTVDVASNPLAMTRLFTHEGSYIQPNTFTTANYSHNVDPQIPAFLSELRTHNTELRININRVSDKVDRVMNKVDNYNTSSKVLNQLQTVEQNLLSQLAQFSQRIHEVNKAVKKSGIKTQNFNSSLSEEENETYLQMYKKNIELSAEVSQCKKTLEELKGKLSHLNSLKAESQKRLENEKENNNSLEKERLLIIEKFQNHVDTHEKQLKNWQIVANKTADTIFQIDKNIIRYKQESNNCDKNVKTIMVAVLKKLLLEFPSGSSKYTSSEVHSTLADVIKACTMEYLQSTSSNSNKDLDVDSSSSLLTNFSTSSGNMVSESTSSDINSTIYVLLDESNIAKLPYSVDSSVDNRNNCEDDLKEEEVIINDCSLKCSSSSLLDNTIKDYDFNRKDGSSKQLKNDTAEMERESDSEVHQENIDHCNQKNDSIKLYRDNSFKIEQYNEQKLESNNFIKVTSENPIFNVPVSIEDKNEIIGASLPFGSTKNVCSNDSVEENWQSQPPPLLFDEDEKDNDDDWLKV